MQQIIIDKEFQELLPPLDHDTYRLLEESILEHGVLTPLVTWNDGNGEILIDGHNRYRICAEHGIPFETVGMEFSSREDVIIWIILNQVARRNLAPMQLSYYRGRHYKSEKVIVTNPEGKNQYGNADDLVVAQNELQPNITITAERLARHYKVSQATIKRDEQVADAIDAIGKESPEAKRKILAGEANIPKKYLKLATSEGFDVADLATKLEEGTFERKKPSAEGKPAIQGQTGQEMPGLPRIHDSVAAMEAAIRKTVNIIKSEHAKIKKDADKSKLKAALKACIERIEEAYGLI